jgi:phosphoglucomutase
VVIRLEALPTTRFNAARSSGTEDIYKLYVESFLGADHLYRILEEARQIVSDTLAASPQQPGILSET